MKHPSKTNIICESGIHAIKPMMQLFSALLQRKALCAVMILVCCDKSITGMVTLSPMMVAPVCRVGDPLQLTCTAFVEFIRWNVLQPNEDGILEEITNPVQINSRDPAQQLSPRSVNSATFAFIRTSAQFALPLISTLSIDLVDIGLNGTVVRCSDITNPMSSASTTVYIIDTSQDIQYTPGPKLSISETYLADYVTVTVEWSQQVGAVYNVGIVPMVPITITGSTRRQMIIPYNTKYVLNVEAVAPCRANATASTNLTLNYVPKVVGYNDDLLILEGSAINLICPPGLALTGPSSATCTENGEWVPDPNGLKCRVTCEHLFKDTNSDSVIAMDYLATEGTTVNFSCPPQYVLVGPNTTTCMGNGEWEPDPREVECKGMTEIDIFTAAVSSSVVTIFLIISIIIFVIGIFCGQYFGRRSPKNTPHITTGQPQTHQVTTYEGVHVPVKAVKNQEQDLQLEENIAYHPASKSTDIEHYQ